MQIAINRHGNGPGGALVWSVVLAAWSLALLIPSLGHGAAHTETVFDGSPPSPQRLLVFLAAWQVMTGAMMLPSTVPLIGLFVRASRGQAQHRLVVAVFLLAYFAVWTGFALIALAGDAGMQHLVGRWRWLDERSHLIAGVVLIGAGLFQFSPLKERCLDACRTPGQFLWRFYRRGTGGAWSLGIRHGLFCLGCCWALMLTMFAVGVGSLFWMATLTGVMMIEKTSPKGRRLVPVVGVALLVWGGIILVQPDWLPSFAGASTGGSAGTAPVPAEHHHHHQ